MATVTSWVETLNAGETVVYPFVGTEWLWLLIAVVFWITWHVRPVSYTHLTLPTTD